MTYVSTITGTVSSTATTRAWSLTSTGVQAGDLVIACLPIVGHVLSRGSTSYRSSRLALPPRWRWVGAVTVQRGGDPSRLQEAVLYAALVAEAPDVGASWVFTSLEESPLSDPAWEVDYPVRAHAHVLRGEVGINSLRVAPIAGSSVTPAEGWTPSGSGIDLIEAYAAHTYAAVSDGLGGVTRRWSPADLRLERRTGGHPAAYDPTTGVADAMTSRALTDGDAATPVTGVAVTLSISGAGTPLRPELSSPAEGAVLDAVREGVSLGWEHRGSTVGPQTAYAIRRASGGTTQWWNGSTWVASETTISSEARALTLPAGGAWSYGSTYTLAVATRGLTGGLSEYSAPSSIIAAAAPTLAVTMAERQADGTVPTSRPTIGAAVTTASGLSVTGWQAEVVSAGEAVASASGDGPMTGWTVPLTLTNGATYDARVRAQQTGGAWSPWASLGFRVVEAFVPVVSTAASYVQAAVHAVSGAPGLAVSVGWAGGFPYATTPVQVSIERSSNGGARWVPAHSGALSAGGPYVWTDYMAPSARQVIYRARGTATINGRPVVGEWATVGSAHMPSDVAGWVVPDGAPELAVRAVLVSRSAEYGTGTMTERPLGRRYPLASHEEGGAAAYSIGLRTETIAQRDAVVAAAQGSAPLLVRFCLAEGPAGAEPEGDVYGVAVGRIAVTKSGSGPHAARGIALTITEQEL